MTSRRARATSSRFMQLNPARGRKRSVIIILPRVIYGLCSSTPRGDGNPMLPSYHSGTSRAGFMQLNPARGRKQLIINFAQEVNKVAVYAAQPREGTETHVNFFADIRGYTWFMQLNPARGRKPIRSWTRLRMVCHFGLCSSTPRGDGNLHAFSKLARSSFRGLCSSTPRGDGNSQDAE